MFEFLKKKKQILEKEQQEEITSKASVTRLQNQIRKIKYDMQIERLQRLKDELEEQKLQQEIEDYENMIYSDEEEEESQGNPEDILMSAVLSKFMNKNTQSSPLSSSLNATPQPSINSVHLDDGVLKEHISSMPKSALKKLSKLPDDKRQEIIKEQFVDLDQDTIARAANMIKVVANA